MKKIKFSKVITLLFLAGISVCATAGEESTFLRWTNEVGEVINPTNVSTPNPGAARHYLVKISYEALKHCKSLNATGHNYSKDKTQIGIFSLNVVYKENVKAGMKFRDEVLVAYEPGHYLVLDKVFCY
jgi:hypothetical protein